jgi:hypothetical protein
MPLNLPDPRDIDAWLEVIADLDKAQVAIRSESCPEQAMQRALQLFPDLESQIVYNPVTPTYMLEEIYKRATWSGTRSTIVKHVNSSERILEIASKDSDSHVRMSVAERVKSESILEQLAKDSDQMVRIGVAQNPYATSKILKLVIEPLVPNSAAAVLQNRNCTEEIFRQVAMSQMDADWLPEPLLALAPEDLIFDIYSRAPKNKRYYVLKNLKAPESLLLELFSEEVPDQSHFPLTNSLKNMLNREKLSEEVFLAALKRAPEISRFEFARYIGLSQAMVDALIAMNSVELKLALISNSSVNGELLLGLVNDKSKKVQSALREETYFGKDSEGKYGNLRYQNRDQLWATLKLGVTPKSKKKLSQNSAIAEIFKSVFTMKEFSELSDLYLKSTLEKSFAVDHSHPWLAAATTLDQRDRIIACARVRAAQLGLIEPESLRDDPYFYVMPRVEGGTLKHVMDPFFESFDDLNFRIIRSLGVIGRIIGGNFDVKRLEKSHVLELLEIGDPYFNWKIANEYQLDVDLLVVLAGSPAYRHSTYSESIPSDTLKFGEWYFYSSNGYRIESHPAAIVAVHPMTQSDVRDKLRKSSNQYIRGLFIEDERLFSLDILESAMKDKSAYVRTLVAGHPKSTLQMLEVMASDKDSQVRTAIKLNPNTPAEVKAMMALLKD